MRPLMKLDQKIELLKLKVYNALSHAATKICFIWGVLPSTKRPEGRAARYHARMARRAQHL